MRGKKPRVITKDEIKRIIDLIAEGYSVRYAAGMVLGTANEVYIRKIKQEYPEVAEYFNKHRKKRAYF